jgi:dTDP-4-dehydrorhamnose 3,5-epimerase-like enzyme
MFFFKNGETAWKSVDFPNVIDSTGCLGVVEYGEQIDFDVKRIFFLRDISKDSTRGSHSHRSLKQLIVCLNGSFSLVLDTGSEIETILMTPDAPAMYVDGRVWREMKSFSPDTVMLVLCDREYRFDEVVRSYSDFKEMLLEGNL